MLDGPDAILPRDAPTYILYPAPSAVSVAEANLREDGLERAEAEARLRLRRTSSQRPSSSSSARPADPRDSAPAAAAELAAVAAALEGAAYVCVAIDSTWRQAREMAAKTAASMPVGTKLVRLPTDRDPPPTETETETETARRVRVEMEKKKSPGPGGGDDDETGFPTTGTTGTLPAAPVVDLMVAPAEGCVLTAEAAAAAVRALERRGAFEKEAEAAATSAAATLRAMARSRCMYDPATRAGASRRASGGRRQRVGAVATGGTRGTGARGEAGGE
jgi:hypothetical protein